MTKQQSNQPCLLCSCIDRRCHDSKHCQYLHCGSIVAATASPPEPASRAQSTAASVHGVSEVQASVAEKALRGWGLAKLHHAQVPGEIDIETFCQGVFWLADP